MEIEKDTLREWERTARRGARKAGSSEDLLDDIASEAITRLLRQHPQPDKPKAWLYTAAKNIALDLHRREPREGWGRMPLTNPDREAKDQVYPEHLRQHLGTGLLRQRALLDQLLDVLNERERAFLIAQAAGAPLRDIADKYDTTEATVKTTIARGRKKIRNAYAQAADDLDLT